MKNEKKESEAVTCTLEERKAGAFRDRLLDLLLKTLSLKFISFVIEVVLGIVWFRELIRGGVVDAAIWGVWAGYMAGAFGIYTAGNVGTKRATGGGGR